MFKLGDKVRLIQSPNGNGRVGNETHTVGDTYELKDQHPILESSPGQVWAVRGDKGLLLLDNGTKICWYSHFNVYALGSNLRDYSNDPRRDMPAQQPPRKPCTCDSLHLMRKGCTCGHLEKKVWGLRG